MSDYFDLGSYSRRVTTRSEEAQTWFDRGLMWIYGFNHEEAVACFRRALKADPGLAMACWGIAYAMSPNYNKPFEEFSQEEATAMLGEGREALERATSLAQGASELERALIEALAQRYPHSPIEDFSDWNDAYANAMREVHATFPDDPDVLTLFVEAMLNRTPWQLWDLKNGGPAKGADTLEAVAVLEPAFDRIEGAWEHPGLLHMYIHLMEMSPHPERALRHGDRLGALSPDAGHLQHMATHIDVLCGDYQNVVDRNRAAVIADRKFLAREGSDNFYTFYRVHDLHFLIYGAMFLGQPSVALAAADELAATMPTHRFAELADWLEAYVPMKQHVLIRFGRWEDILAADLPEDRDLYAMTTATMHYARCVALANLHRPEEALAETELFHAALDQVPEQRRQFNNTCRDLLGIAEQMMLGELEYHRGNHDQAFAHLRRSVELDDNLPYDEPWGWMQPTRHALGALLLDQGRLAEAETVYRADLGLDPTLPRPCQHPGNIWSLHGLHECLKRRGEEAERRHVKLLLDKALGRSEVAIRASCYCRQHA